MLSSQRKYILINSLGLLIAIIYSIVADQATLLAFINAYFMIGLSYFCAGAILYVIGEGFFSIFSYTFKKFWRFNSKKEEYVAELEGDHQQNAPNMEVLSFSWTRPLLYSGILLCTITFICSIIFFE